MGEYDDYEESCVICGVPVGNQFAFCTTCYSESLDDMGGLAADGFMWTEHEIVGLRTFYHLRNQIMEREKYGR